MNKNHDARYSLDEIKKRYESGENVIQLLKSYAGDDGTGNSVDAIAISYDLQAGTYTKFAEENLAYKKEQTGCLAETLKKLGPVGSVLEAGVGECTTLAHIMNNLPATEQFLGFDISWSRTRYGKSFCEKTSAKKASLFLGNLFQIPLMDDSVDVVYTFHSVEPNGGQEKEAMQELYRVARKYLVLCEPAFDLAGETAKERMKKHGFACHFHSTALQLGYKVLEHRPFEVCYNELNTTGITIIEKNATGCTLQDDIKYACPITKSPLQRFPDCFYCETSLLAYPVISEIPCLLANNAVVATHLLDFK